MYTDPLKNPSRGLIALLFAVFATVLGVGMAVPLLPLYAHRLGGTGLHIALLSGSFAFSRLVCAPWFGRHSDYHGRKHWIVGGLLLYSSISLLLGQIHDLTLLVAARALHGVAAAMLIPLMQAAVGDLAARGREGRLMGLHGAAALAGLGIGPILGGMISDRLGIGAAFMMTALFTAIGAAACAIYLSPGRTVTVRLAARPAPWPNLLRDRMIAGVAVFRFCHVVGVGIVSAFLPLYMTTTGPLGTTAAGLVVGLGVSTSGLLNLPMGALADRTDRRRLILMGGFIGACGIFAIGSADTLRDFVVASICLGAGGGIAMPAVMAIATHHGRHGAAMGSMMALMNTIHSAGMLTGALLGGLIMDRSALTNAFPAGAVIMAFGVLVFAGCCVHRARADELEPAALPIPSLTVSKTAL